MKTQTSLNLKYISMSFTNGEKKQCELTQSCPKEFISEIWQFFNNIIKYGPCNTLSL